MVAALVTLGLAGCTPPAEGSPTLAPEPPATSTPVASPTPESFTVLTSGSIRTADPALALGDTDALIGTNIYQRLMYVQPDTGELKPDAATDCLFTSETAYECTLPEGLTFHNGNELTSSDVRFSIQRALRLATQGTAIPMLESLVRITTPDARTVRFRLGQADTSFGYALASLAASIVDEESFDPDSGLPLEGLPVGSGPYQVESIGEDQVTFTRFPDYRGPLAGSLERIQLVRVTDSVAAEDAIAAGTADLVWRTLDPPATQRLAAEIAASPDQVTAQGFSRAAAPPRYTRLEWSAESEWRTDATLRQGVALALQADRTLSSLVPAGVEGSIASFELGGRPTLPEIEGGRVTLTLGYDASTPGQADLARMVRDRIEELDRVSVRLVTEPDADLKLTDHPAWVNSALGWLQAYTDAPLPGSAEKLADLVERARSTTGNARLVALSELQKQAAADLTVLPVTQTDGILMLGPGVALAGQPFGSSGQLGLWGIQHG